MEGQEVVLIRPARLPRAPRQYTKRIYSEIPLPVISFCMNIPGPIKTNDKIKKASFPEKKLCLMHYKKRTFWFSHRLNLMIRPEMKSFLQLTIRQIKSKI